MKKMCLILLASAGMNLMIQVAKSASLDGIVWGTKECQLHEDARLNKKDDARWLLNNGTNVNAANPYGYRAVHWAAQYGSLETLEVLLTSQTIDVNAVTCEGWTALHIAIMEGHTNIAKRLLADSRVKIDIADRAGRTPMFFASYTDTVGKKPMYCTDYEIRDLLLARGVRPLD